MVEGEQLSGLWDELTPSEKFHVRKQCRKAISILRRIPIWVADSGMHNVLYSKESKAVTLVDFESIGDCTTPEEIQELNAPELLAIFGPPIMAEPITGG